MPSIREAVRLAIDEMRKEYEDQKIGAMRFAWNEGIKTLYKFKNANADESIYEVLDIIENSRVYFSKLEQLNDPLDCLPHFQYAKDPTDVEFLRELRQQEDQMIAELKLSEGEVAEMRKTVGTSVEEMPAAIKRLFREALERDIRLFCMSSTREHPLLWAHYADKHKGVCLHFKVGRNTLFGLARGVQYFEKRPAVLIPLHYNDSSDEVATAMSLAKAACWNYEAEYRIIGHESVAWGYKFDGQLVSFPPDCLTGITLGMKINPLERGMIRQISAKRTPPLDVYEAYENPSDFLMQFRKLEADQP